MTVLSSRAAAVARQSRCSFTNVRCLATTTPIPSPGRGPPVTNPKDVVRTPDDLRLMNRTGKESEVCRK